MKPPGLLVLRELKKRYHGLALLFGRVWCIMAFSYPMAHRVHDLLDTGIALSYIFQAWSLGRRYVMDI